MHRLLAFSALALLGSVVSAQVPFDVRALLDLNRISDPQISPDGASVLFTVQSINVSENSRPRQVWIVPVAGGQPRQLTTQGNNSRARWSPDGKLIAFLSDRGGTTQVWTMEPSGASAKALTNLSTEADGHVWSPDGKYIVLISEVFPECPDEACNQRRIEEEKASKLQARVYTSLLYRHWNAYNGKRRKHLLAIPIEGGTWRDLTPMAREVPPFSLGGQDDYAISPDSLEVVFAMNTDERPELSTNSDLWTVPIEGGAEPKKISENLGADNAPVYSPDGRWIAYRRQDRAGFESDRWKLALYDRTAATSRILTEGLDRPVGTIAFTPDSRRIVFTVEDRGRTSLHMVPVTGGSSRAIVSGTSTVDDPQFSPDGKTLIYTEMTGSKPTEIYRASSSGGPPVPLTRLNDAILARYNLPAFEEFWVEGSAGARVHSFLVKPPNFDPNTRYPVLFLIHGGPQGAWSESWSYRWNPQVFAAAGFVCVMPNPRGSTGYGQRFTDEISGDWGGKVYDDILSVVNHVARLPFADRERFAAAGGSYGGYMVNWLLGHSDRFKAFVSHAGVYDLRSMAAETEELWFVNWEFGGMPWQAPETYERWSPSNFVKDFKTPTLVIHGDLDYRVPVGQGLQLFTGLQMQKVPSKLLMFPDEGHWVLKPQNSVLWYTSFIDWITEWTRKAPPSAAPVSAPVQ